MPINLPQTAIIYYGNEITGWSLSTWYGVAGGLKTWVKGDRVYLGLQNCPQFILSYFCVQSPGACCIGQSHV